MTFGDREALWARIEQTNEWDVLVIGGGITGAGILREAVRAGLRALLVEAQDFAWGTSSRSSKMVHGGLRYFKQLQVGLTYHSVRERDHLLRAGAGLVKPLPFVMPIYRRRDKPVYRTALSIYDLMATRWDHREYTPDEIGLLIPRLSRTHLEGGFQTEDAQTDDARLVLRVLDEAVASGATALNYVRAESVIRESGNVVGATIRNVLDERTHTIHARVVINATGAWADRLRTDVHGEKRIRPLRGSHLIFSSWRFPLEQAVSFIHPEDKRPVFAFPWEGVTLVGTTDLDHADDLDLEPRISGEEVAYLLTACRYHFPSLELTAEDVISTFAGVRPVVGTGKADPSKEARDHIVMVENGLISVTGGKLTTYRLIALDTLEAALPYLPEGTRFDPTAAPLNHVAKSAGFESLPDEQQNRLLGRYGANSHLLAEREDLLVLIPNTNTLWAELYYAAQHELVAHLDDLLLRRTRIGLLLPHGGLDNLARIREVCAPVLTWDNARWHAEITRYRTIWESHYRLPPSEEIPDWMGNFIAEHVHRPRRRLRAAAAASALMLAAVLIAPLVRRRNRADRAKNTASVQMDRSENARLTHS